MKKILIIIAVFLCIFQMVVLTAAIDIGGSASDRSFTMDAGYTCVDKDNPANDTGTISSVELYCVTELKDVEVATFFVVSGNNLSTRDSAYIGTVTGGSKQTFSGLSIDVQTGDYLGIYTGSQAGTYERDTAGGDGIWYKSGDYIPCTNVTYSFLANNVMSFYGTGTTTPTFPIAKFGGVAITKWNTKEITKWNTIP